MLNPSWSFRKWIWSISLLVHFTPPPWPLSSLNHFPFQNIPRWHSGKESVSQCRRCRFKAWVRKIPQRRKCQPAPLFWPGKFHGKRSLVGYSPWDCKESDKPEHTHTPSFLLWSAMTVSSSLFNPGPFSCCQQNVLFRNLIWSHKPQV